MCNEHPLTLLEAWVAQEEVIAAPCWGSLASIWLEHRAQLRPDLINFVEDGEDTLLEQLVSLLLAQVELATLQAANWW